MCPSANLGHCLHKLWLWMLGMKNGSQRRKCMEVSLTVKSVYFETHFLEADKNVTKSGRDMTLLRSILRTSCSITGRCRISWLPKKDNLISCIMSYLFLDEKKTQKKTQWCLFALSWAPGLWVCSRWSKLPPVLRCTKSLDSKRIPATTSAEGTQST